MKVSVIVPVYAVENLIERCANSLFAQTLDDIEYIFIDDCSPDNSVNVLQTVLDLYPSRKSQVKLIRLPENIGVAAVRRYGIELAEGEYVICCDSDDCVVAEMYEQMYIEAKINDSDIVICDYNINDCHNGNMRITHNLPTDKCVLISKFLSGRIHSSLCNKLVKRSLYDEDFIYPKGNMREDLAILIQLLCRAKIVNHLDRAYYNYYIQPESISSTSTDKRIVNAFEHSKLNYELIKNYISLQDYDYSKPLLALKLSIKMALWKLRDKKMRNTMWSDFTLHISAIDLICLDVPTSYKLKCLIIYIQRLFEKQC